MLISTPFASSVKDPDSIVAEVGSSPIKAIEDTVLPEPDSPTIAVVCPG